MRARAWPIARLGTVPLKAEQQTAVVKPTAFIQRRHISNQARSKSTYQLRNTTSKRSRSTTMSDINNEVGLKLPNGCRITHGQGGNVKKPFSDLDLTMHELSPINTKGFRGQLGFIAFTPAYRLPRHIHMDLSMSKLVDERILVLHGVGLVEVAGEIFAAAPGTLVDAVGGVPHTWTACPAGVKLPDGTVSEGKFTMVYEYEEQTMFYPTASTEIVASAAEYKKFEGSDYEEIRFPKLTKEQVVERAKVIIDREIHRMTLA